MQLEAGMLARSKKGRDKNCIYVIISVNDEYVDLADGSKWTICQPKRKNKKHIQPIKKAGIIGIDSNNSIKKQTESFVNHKIN